MISWRSKVYKINDEQIKSNEMLYNNDDDYRIDSCI